MTLPSDCINIILSYLDIREIFSSRLLCKAWEKTSHKLTTFGVKRQVLGLQMYTHLKAGIWHPTFEKGIFRLFPHLTRISIRMFVTALDMTDALVLIRNPQLQHIKLTLKRPGDMKKYIPLVEAIVSTTTKTRCVHLTVEDNCHISLKHGIWFTTFPSFPSNSPMIIGFKPVMGRPILKDSPYIHALVWDGKYIRIKDFFEIWMTNYYQGRKITRILYARRKKSCDNPPPWKGFLEKCRLHLPLDYRRTVEEMDIPILEEDVAQFRDIFPNVKKITVVRICISTLYV